MTNPDAGEVLNYTFDYSRTGAIGTGTTIASATVVLTEESGIDPNPSSRINGSVFVVSGLYVVANIGPLLAGLQYIRTCTAIGTDGQIYVDWAYINVNPAN